MRTFQRWHIRSKLLHNVSLAHEDARGSLFPDVLIKGSVIEKWKNGNLTLGILNPMSWTELLLFCNFQCFLCGLIANESKHSKKMARPCLPFFPAASRSPLLRYRRNNSIQIWLRHFSSRSCCRCRGRRAVVANFQRKASWVVGTAGSASQSSIFEINSLGRDSSRLGKLSILLEVHWKREGEKVILKLRRLFG